MLCLWKTCGKPVENLVVTRELSTIPGQTPHARSTNSQVIHRVIHKQPRHKIGCSHRALPGKEHARLRRGSKGSSHRAENDERFLPAHHRAVVVRPLSRRRPSPEDPDIGGGRVAERDSRST